MTSKTTSVARVNPDHINAVASEYKAQKIEAWKRKGLKLKGAKPVRKTAAKKVAKKVAKKTTKSTVKRAKKK